MRLNGEELEILSDISNEIFNENFDQTQTFEQQIDNNVETPSFAEQNLQDLISSIKGKLDIIIQNCSNEVDSPKISYLKSLLTTDLNSFSISLDNYIAELNSGINFQQNQNIGLTSISSKPVIVSIPL